MSLSLNSKHLTLRARKKSDEAFLRKAYESSREEETAPVMWVNDAQRNSFFEHQFNAQQAHFDNFYSDMEYDIIEYDKKPIGRLGILWEKSNAFIVDLIIIPAFQKKGIGSLVMEAIIKEADKKNITATVMYEKWKPHNEKFYAGFGFKTTKEYPMHFLMRREVSSTDFSP